MLSSALYFGADAVYLGHKTMSLRAFAGNFDESELKLAADAVHAAHKKLYVTLNIFARNTDFSGVRSLLELLTDIGCDGVIVSDLGLIGYIREFAPKLAVHVSTQANVTNAYSVKEYIKLGVKRVVLARELSLAEIREIGAATEGQVELEAFVHGAMCVSYSGRCLLSNALTGRASNLGACAQSCRLSYRLTEEKSGREFDIVEDGGTYLLNSRDLNMLAHIGLLMDAGVTSFKLEGRAKSVYYVSNAVNAYRRAIDITFQGKPIPPNLLDEPEKAANRGYGTGFYFPENRETENRTSSKPISTHEFVGIVRGVFEGGILLEMRNRFCVGEEMEVLSPRSSHNTRFVVSKIETEAGAAVDDAKRVQDIYRIYTDVPLMSGDILRRKI